jgi:hypothetical protein
MHKWYTRDRDGHEIYLTEERWQHIVEGHPELQEHLEDILKAVQRGRRKQQPRDPHAYVYRWPCDSLPSPFNGILVSVVFRFEEQPDGGMIPNNFIVTAWGIMMRP